jgi:hypothetical protein
MTNESPRDISEILSDPNVVIEAINEATQEAVRRHKQMGVPMAIWKDGRVTWVAPEELEQSNRKNASHE